MGLLHLDIKPDNILIGSDDENNTNSGTIYLIDFGISKNYTDCNGTHLCFKNDVPFSGNIVFASKNAFLLFGETIILFNI